MKRKVMALFLAVVMTVSLAACGSSSSSSDDTGSTADSGSADASDESTAASDDTVYNLTLSHSEPATAPVGVALEEWAEEIYEASDGRLNITVYASSTLATPTDELSMVEEGSIDICWQATPMNTGRFPVLSILNTPTFEMNSSYQVTEAIQTLYETNEAVQEEFAAINVKLLALHANGTCTLSSRNTKFETLDDFKGFLIRANNEAYSGIVEYLGASAVSCSVSEVYENLSKNVMNGNLSDTANVIATSAYEQLDYLMDYSFGCTPGFVAMNQDVYDSLPSDLQQILDDSYETLSASLTEKFNEYMVEFFETTAAEVGMEIYDVTDEVAELIEEANQSVNVDTWMADMEEMGYDADALYEAFETALADAEEMYGEEYHWIQ